MPIKANLKIIEKNKEMEEKIYTYRIWEASKNTGFESLDHHHKKFVDVINNLVDILNDKKEESEVLDIFHKLLYYAEIYFIDEELAYQKSDYKELKRHQEEHKDFIAEISKFRKEFKANDKTVCVRMMKYLDIWYKNHILGEDSDAAKGIEKKK